ncbi:spectrin beta chain, erythrocytic-like [Lytechinus variegatus]|uniref:spectrin beta chain, erythrocytic-like n=1 Tax=Lytechinus variegatus TaxID=7654 RepID=UPI001BB169F7|nr:spectrin beta chain, erythrocytic-like [Lytechinus variegatus]
MGCKPCKCCGCFGSRDDIPYFIDANAPMSRPLSKRKAKAAAKEREKEKEEYRKSKGKSPKAKVSLRTRLLGKKDKKGKPKRGDSWSRRPSGQVQYSHIPDRDSEDINSEDFSLISEVLVESDGARGGQTLQAKEALMAWAQRNVKDYPGVQVKDFGRSWRDGLAFNAIIHRNRPDLIDFQSLKPSEHRANLERAFSTAEKHLGVTRLLDPEDVDVPKPDDKSIMTYVSSLYNVFPKVPESSTSFSSSEVR